MNQMNQMNQDADTIYEKIVSGNIIDTELKCVTTESLRKFHNWIKLQLILDSKKMTQGTKLLDVAVGRGGDIVKWAKGRFRYVTGFDCDAKSIYEKNDFDGAIKRYNSVKSEANMPKCYFWNISATDPFALNSLNGKDRECIYDVVSCQFSFHYFVKDIDIVLNLISKKLRTNGIFIGTAMDGDCIKNILKNGNIKNEAMCIEHVSEEMYSFTLNSEKTPRETYFEYRGASTEYFLFKQHLVEKCKTFNMIPLMTKSFHEWYNSYTSQHLLTQEDLYCSFLNFSFVFKKC